MKFSTSLAMTTIDRLARALKTSMADKNGPIWSGTGFYFEKLDTERGSLRLKYMVDGFSKFDYPTTVNQVYSAAVIIEGTQGLIQ
jgi:hypothetical protein